MSTDIKFDTELHPDKQVDTWLCHLYKATHKNESLVNKLKAKLNPVLRNEPMPIVNPTPPQNNLVDVAHLIRAQVERLDRTNTKIEHTLYLLEL